jgi:hypothetical protein
MLDRLPEPAQPSGSRGSSDGVVLTLIAGQARSCGVASLQVVGIHDGRRRARVTATSLA